MEKSNKKQNMERIDEIMIDEITDLSRDDN
jgi:hypothetical protein